MRPILLTSVGSRGDVQPFLALALALRAAGFPVKLATLEGFRGWVEAHGIAFAPIRADIMGMLASEEGREMMHGGTNPIVFFRKFMALCKDLVDTWAVDTLSAAEDAEAIIHSYVAWAPGQGVAQLKGIPAIGVHLQPLVPTRHFPAPFFPWRHDLPPWFHRATWWLFQTASWNFIRPELNAMRVRHFGCEPLGRSSRNGPERIIDYPMLHAYSSHVVPKPDDWGANHHVTGYWVMPPSRAWQPDPALERFLAEGPAPVYLGFGSMTVASPERELEMLVSAAAAAGVRAVISAGWSGMESARVPGHCFVLNEAPHDWLFPRMAGVIHHGGAGTTAAALHAGVPQMVCPFIADQPFWGHRLQMIGVGPKPMYHRRLTPEALAERMRDLTGNPRYRENAADAGRRIRAEDGVANAVRIIADTLGAVPET